MDAGDSVQKCKFIEIKTVLIIVYNVIIFQQLGGENGEAVKVTKINADSSMTALEEVKYCYLFMYNFVYDITHL